MPHDDYRCRTMIGYYAHHHGSGHVTRATSIAAASTEPVTVLSSRPRPAHSSVDWVDLPVDVDDSGGCDGDASAAGTMHWAPVGVRGMIDRMAMIADWVATYRPRVFVVDVSVEVAVFVRLLGVDVVVVAMPGERTDDPHTLAYRTATAILAPWAQAVYDPPWLHPFAHKTSYVGVISRFDGRPRTESRAGNSVVVLGGAGGSSLTETDVTDAAAANPEYRWHPVGMDTTSWIDDVWPLLCSATAVVTHAGQNALADVAAAGTRALVIPQTRPFGEQVASARALADAGIVVTRDSWPAPENWTSILEDVAALDQTAWTRVSHAGAARRAAELLVR